jgi:hypothetical protein
MNLADITPLILTWNEGTNIERTLAGLSWAEDRRQRQYRQHRACGIVAFERGDYTSAVR